MRIKDTRLTTIILSWIQILGGIYGLGLIASILLKMQQINGAVLLIILSGIALYVFSIVSGRYLLSKNNFKLGLILTLINFVFQLIDLKTNGYGFSYSSGINLMIGYANGFKFSFALITSNFNMSINTDELDFVFKLNLAAIFIIWLIIDIYEENYGKTNEINKTIEQ